MASTPSVDRKIACNVCRRRKTACDKARPQCGLCAKSNFDCEYAESQTQPGLRAGYVQQLERRIDELEERLASVETQLRSPSQQHPQRGPNAGCSAVISTSATPTQGLHDGPSGFPEPGIPNLEYHQHATPPSPPVFSRNNEPLYSPAESPPFHPLSYSVASELSRVWFGKYHRFFPILHQPSFNQLLRTDWTVTPHGLVVQAVVATTLQHSGLLDGDIDQRRRWQEQLAGTIVIECIKRPSLQALQALMILAILQYGEGKFVQSSSFLAMARRMCAHFGISATLQNDTAPEMSPTALRRLPAFTNTAIDEEEKIRAFWMIETLDSTSTLGARYDTGRLAVTRTPLLPCRDAFWSYPEPILIDENTKLYDYCSAFSLCIMLAVGELAIVHRFLQKNVNMETFEERDAWQIEAQRIDERLTAWRDEFVATVFRLINTEFPRHEHVEMDTHIVLTNCVLNAAVITLLQQRVACPAGIEQFAEPWAFASNRCVYASENTAFKVRQMDEDQLSICHPHLVFSIFVAARFYIVHSKALDANVPTNLHSLAFALHVCGKRWPLARIYEHVIRVAVAEYRTPVLQSRVPKSFYNLQLTTFEVSDELVAWAEAGPGANINLTLDAQGEHVGVMNFSPMAIDVLA